MTLTRRQKTEALSVLNKALEYGSLVYVGYRTIKVYTDATFNIEVDRVALDVDVKAKLIEQGYRLKPGHAYWWERKEGDDDE